MRTLAPELRVALNEIELPYEKKYDAFTSEVLRIEKLGVTIGAPISKACITFTLDTKFHAVMLM
jgi:hypothetical protein